MSKIKKEIEERQNYSISRRSRDTALRLSKSGAQKLKNYGREDNLKASINESILGLEHSSFLEYNSPVNKSIRTRQGNSTFVNKVSIINQSITNLNASMSNRSITKEQYPERVFSSHQQKRNIAHNSYGDAMILVDNFLIDNNGNASYDEPPKKHKEKPRRRPQSHISGAWSRTQATKGAASYALNHSMGKSFNQVNPYASFDRSSNFSTSQGNSASKLFKPKKRKATEAKHSGKATFEFNDNASLKTRNQSIGQSIQIIDMLKESCYATKKCSAVVQIDMKNIDKEQTLNENEILRIFQARNLDLGLPFFDQQYLRFKDYCLKNCINRRIKLTDLGMGVNTSTEISQIIAVNPNIAHIDLKKNLIGDEGSKILVKAIAKSKTVIHLDLSSNQITHKGAKKIFQSLLPNISLISLKLGSIDGINKNKIGYKGLSTLPNLLQTSKYLQFLDLRGNILSDNGVLTLCESLQDNKTLISLNISNNDITSYGMEKLKDALLTTKVQELDMSGNPLGNQGLEYLGKYVENSSCELLKLNVSECKFQGAGSMMLMHAIRRNTKIKCLTMDKNDIRTRNTNYLTTGIYANLQYLSMVRCNIGDDGGVSIAEGVFRSKTLKTVILPFNNLSDDSARAFSEALSKIGCPLENLDLSYNKINDSGGELIAASLKNNTNLSKLSLYKNNLKFTTGAVFVESMRQNSQIQLLNLDGNCINLNYIEDIQEILQENMIRAAKNKIPTYKNEVVQLKIEHEASYQKTLTDIQRCHQNKQSLIEQVQQKERLKQQYEQDEKEKFDEIDKEREIVERRFKQSMAHYIDEENKIKMIVEKKSKELQDLEKWINKFVADQEYLEEHIYEKRLKVKKIKKDHAEEVKQCEKELFDSEETMENVRNKYYKIKEEYKFNFKITASHMTSPTQNKEITLPSNDGNNPEENQNDKKKKGGKSKSKKAK